MSKYGMCPYFSELKKAEPLLTLPEDKTPVFVTS
jgi:hypothetical protein